MKSLKSKQKTKFINRNPSVLNDIQYTSLLGFIKQYNKNHKKSKSVAKDSREYLCNNRKSSSGYRLETKEIAYPIIATKSKGSKIWDIDGNEYVDLSMGYGANLFGHKPHFLQKALLNQVNDGYQIGPEAEFAKKCAKLISDLTNTDRVLFCNSGSEAVMTAIRIARAYTKKDKIVIFQESYHGHNDSTLIMKNDNKSHKPSCIGIPESLVEDMILLPFDSEESIKEIAIHSDQIAAVLTEPVQNSDPDNHPKSFLKKLRKVTESRNISLIFDEVLVGVRIAAGGAQEWYGIKADLVTYGKIVGGGLPIGVVAGVKNHMNLVDGGMWKYGDNSLPSSDTIFTAGTFCKHPLAMAASFATLNHIKNKGKELYSVLNKKSLKLYKVLNEIFNFYDIPIKVCSFGSFFRFAQDSNLSFVAQPLELDIFFYYLIQKGVYVWECKTCFITTAHTDSDMNKIVSSVHETIIEMKHGGFWNQSCIDVSNKEFKYFDGKLTL